MATAGLKSLVQQLRRLAGERETSSRTDSELLTRFAASRDESAFEEIVQRHGPLVWAICRTNLSAADADDAFQATFLVLARRANAIRKPASLAAWLSGVARKTVQSVRMKRARRREVPLEAADSAATSHDADAYDSRAAVAEEVERLPEKYRLPTLLCYVQGLTNEEAARRLGWPHGTVCGRLARARNLLRSRLTRRGLAITTPALVTGLGRPSTELLAATLAQTVTTTQTASALKLAEAVMNAMWLTKIKVAAISLLTVAVIGTGTGWVLVPAAAQDGKQPSKDKPRTESFAEPPAAIQPPPGLPEKIDEKTANELLKKAMEMTKPSPLADAKAGDAPVRVLAKEKHRVAANELKLHLANFEAGPKGVNMALLLGSVQRVYDSEIALGSQPAERIAAAMRAFTIAKAIAAVNRGRFDFGQIAQQDLEYSRYVMLDFQIKATRTIGAESFNPRMIGD